MSRLRALALTTCATAALTAATPAVAAAPVAPALKGTLTKLKAKTKLPVLLPASFPVARGGRKLYPLITTTAKEYSVDLGLAPDCNGANVCSVGYLGATRTAKVPGAGDGTKVTLHQGVVGRFRPLSCGASCSPPSITFRRSGVNYTYQLKIELKQGQTDRGVLKTLADQALDAGPR